MRVYVCDGCGAPMTHAQRCQPGCESIEAHTIEVAPIAEVERLSDALRTCAGQLGAAHQAMEGPNAGWVEFSDGDGYYDDDLVCTPTCTVCIAQAKASTALGDGHEPAQTTEETR